MTESSPLSDIQQEVLDILSQSTQPTIQKLLLKGAIPTHYKKNSLWMKDAQSNHGRIPGKFSYQLVVTGLSVPITDYMRLFEPEVKQSAHLDLDRELRPRVLETARRIAISCELKSKKEVLEQENNRV